MSSTYLPPIGRSRAFGISIGRFVMVLCSVLLFALLAGAAIGLASTFAALAFIGVAGGAVALVLPLRWMVVALLVMSFLVAGQLTYFAGIDKAFWFPFLMGALLLVRHPLDLLPRSRRGADAPGTASRTPFALRFLIGVFLATVVASTLINTSPPLQIFVSSKEYLFLWGLYLALAAGLLKPDFVVRVWALLPWLMLLQLPIIFYQRFVVMPSRSGAAAFDAVVGAFGGDPMGGGASNTMGLFCIIGIVIVVARWRQRLIPGWQALLLCSGGALSIGLAEVKFMVLLLPVAFVLLYRRDLMRKPLQNFVMIVVGFALAFGVLIAYKTQYDSMRKPQTTAEYFERMFKGNTDTEFVNMQTRQIGRVASVVFWYREHDIGDPAQFFLGHGAGSSRIGGTVIGEAAANYVFQITRSSIGILLWETGIIGTIAYLGLLVAAYFTLHRQSTEAGRSAESTATLASMSVAVAVFIASIPYSSDMMGSHQLQILLMLCLGYASMSNTSSSSRTQREAQARAGASKAAVGVPARAFR